MSDIRKPLDLFWFIPTSGDGPYLGTQDRHRPAEFRYLREIATAVDRLGYTGVLLPTGRGCEDAWITATALATATERLRFLVALRPGVATPAFFARQAAALDRISQGRLLLNVVVGGDPAELAGDGVFLDHDTRYAQAAEFLTIWRGLLAGETVDFDGDFLKVQGGKLSFPPVQQPHPPLWYGVGLPANAAWPAENHINIVALGLRDTTQATIKAYREARVAKGFDLNGTLMGVSRHVIVADTDEAALAIARRTYPRWRQSFRWLFNRHGAEPRVIGIYPETFDALVGLNNGIAGSPATVRRFVEAEIAANGCNYFVPQMVFGDMTLKESLRSIELFGKEVMPAFAK